MADWEINRPLGQCCGTGRTIEPGEDYYGALVETEQGLQRRDFSGDYWEQEKPSVFCFWKTRLAPPNEKKRLFVSDDMLMAFFERLAPETDAEKVSFRFVLALVLMRKRRLKYDSTRMDGPCEIWRLRVTGEKDPVEVVNPHLDESQIETLTSQIGQILQADL
ncbi:MAG: hypothetical protein FJ280_13040 [Planctomycetes bacterium]|nr:hypothetical protein [Planctomycetota bacterium]